MCDSGQSPEDMNINRDVDSKGLVQEFPVQLK